MAVIQAQAIGTPLADWFRDVGPIKSRVVARFDSTLLLQGDAEQLWAITTRANAGAHRIVAPSLPAWQVGELVRIHNGALVGDSLAVCWNDDALWDPRPRRRALNQGERAAAARELAALVQAHGLPDAHGFWQALADLWQAPHTKLAALMARHLVGRGPGLTPAGDDLLQALLVTLQSGDDADRQTFRQLADVTASLLTRTTPLSQMFLQEALQGWAFGPLKALLDALPDVPSALGHDLLRVGASSGVSSVLGVTLGLLRS